MGLLAFQPVDARHRHAAHRRYDPFAPRRRQRPGRRWGIGGCALILLLWPVLASAETSGPPPQLRLAVWNVELEHSGPGLLLQAILAGDDPQLQQALQQLTALNADVLLLMGFDYDHDLIAAQAFAAKLALQGPHYPYRFALRPNLGRATGLDLNGDGRLGDPADAQGYGAFSGQAGMLLLSRLPIAQNEVVDLSSFLWADLPGAILPPGMEAQILTQQRLPTTGHWIVPVILADGRRLRLLCWHATPPVFDGPEDRNGRRNHDEAALWLALLQNRLALAPPQPPFALLGSPNLDPVDGEGRPEALRQLLAFPALYDSQPHSPEAVPPDPGQQGDPRYDTAVFAQTGGLRLEMILLSQDIGLRAAGIARQSTANSASRHFPIWADITLP